MADQFLSSPCTCPDRKIARVRNITGHAPECPCYAEWYRRYAPQDAGEYIPAVVSQGTAPDQLGPATGPPDDTPAARSHRGADWAIQDGTAITLASIKAENPPTEDGDGDEQPEGRG